MKDVLLKLLSASALFASSAAQPLYPPHVLTSRDISPADYHRQATAGPWASPERKIEIISEPPGVNTAPA
jgi:hypothetical protein